MVIGSSILRNQKLATPAAIVRCIPGARVNRVESHLKLLPKSNRTCGRIKIHGHDTGLGQSKVIQINVESVCVYAETTSDSIVFFGPLPSLTSADKFSFHHFWNFMRVLK